MERERRELDGKWVERNESFQKGLSDIANRLAVVAILVAVILGIAQVIAAIIVASN